jgi:hypothetical protein
MTKCSGRKNLLRIFNESAIRILVPQEAVEKQMINISRVIYNVLLHGPSRFMRLGALR